jgi:hypothetical protein
MSIETEESENNLMKMKEAFAILTQGIEVYHQLHHYLLNQY